MAISGLTGLFRNCLHRRIGTNKFIECLKAASERTPVNSTTITASLLNCNLSFCAVGDPLLCSYFQALITSANVLVSDILHGMVLQWNSSRKHQTSETVVHLIECQSRLLNDLLMTVAQLQTTDVEARRCIILASKWLTALARWTNSDQVKENNIYVNSISQAVGFLLIAIQSSPIGTSILTSDGAKNNEAIVSVQTAAEACMEVHPNIAMQLMNRSSATQKQPGMFQDRQADNDLQIMEMAALEFEAGISDGQIVPSRAATYLYLYTILRSTATVDDSVVYAFLNNRFSANHSMMFNHLLLATLDALTKSPHTQNALYQLQCLIFIHNKLPAILSLISTSSFESIPTEQYLLELWNEISSLNDENVATIGRHFLRICVLHHLIPSTTISTLFAEDATSTVHGLYGKDSLTEQVNNNASRGPRLIEELLRNDGNAGVISLAVQEVMHNYCRARETHHLKDMANAIVRRPSTINSIALYLKPATFLAPLCNLLDEWKWDEIHGESQPIYEEFGSVLCLIMTFKHRLNLSRTNMGSNSDGFLWNYLNEGYAEQDLSKLSDQKLKHLGDWINALYIAEALSDDLTSSCSAKEFYMLIPTLLGQSVMAYSRGKLNQETLKAGLEYLLEPFLLPSLLSAFAWIKQLMEKEPKQAAFIIQILVKQPGLNETREVHKTLLAIAAQMFERKIQLGSSDPELLSMLQSMSQIKPFTLNKDVQASDLNTWTTHDGGIILLLQKCIAAPIPASGGIAYQPTMLTAAIQTHGQVAVVHALISLLLQYSGSHDFHQLLDTVATLIVCSDNHGITLRHATQVIHSKLATFLKKEENLFAEVVVHLSRRVELYTNSMISQAALDQNFLPISGAEITNATLDLTPAPDLEQQDQAPGEDMEQMLNEAAAMGNLDDLDTGLNNDDMYGLQGDNYGLDSLEDFDIDNMF